MTPQMDTTGYWHGLSLGSPHNHLDQITRRSTACSLNETLPVYIFEVSINEQLFAHFSRIDGCWGHAHGRLKADTSWIEILMNHRTCGYSGYIHVTSPVRVWELSILVIQPF